jgi:hypothetical protein
VDVRQVAAVVSAALRAGTPAATRESGSAAVQVAQRALRGVLARRLGADPVVGAAVAGPGPASGDAQEARAWLEQVPALLSGLPKDELREVLVHAQAVLALTDPRGTALGRYAVAFADPPGSEDEANPGAGNAAAATRPVRRYPLGRGHAEPPAGDPVRLLVRRDRAAAPSERRRPAHHEDPRTDLVLSSTSAGSTGAVVDMIERAVADAERRLGTDHADALDARYSLAHVYRWAGRAGDATDAMDRVVAGRERLLGPEHPDTVAARSTLRTWRGA